MRKLTIALSTAALAMSGAAFAQAAPERAARPDVTRAQAQARAEAAFARMDADKNGTIDQADRAARRAGAFDRMDTDRNGSISRAEFDAKHAMDAKRAAGGKKRAAQRLGNRMGKMDGGRMGASAAPMSRQAFVDRSLAMFDKADANRDGNVTQAERKAVRDSMREQRQSRRAARQQG